MKKFFALICAGMIFFAGCGNEEAIQFKTEKVSPTNEVLTLTHEGKISLSQELMVYSNISGEVVEKFFKDGNEVTEGQKLFKIGNATTETELLKTKAALAESMTTLAKEMTKKNPVGELQAEIAELQERVRILEEDSAAGIIYAPVSGQASVNNVHIGENVKANETILAKIGRSNSVVVRFEIPAEEKKILSATEPKISLKFSDGTTYPRAGTIKFLNDTTAEVTFDNPDGVLLLGNTVKICLENLKIPNAVLVPEKAIQQREGETFVLIVDEDKNVVKKKILLSGKIEDKFIVSDGLTADDLVIVDDVGSVKN